MSYMITTAVVAGLFFTGYAALAVITWRRYTKRHTGAKNDA